jgi:hypothetical protein
LLEELTDYGDHVIGIGDCLAPRNFHAPPYRGGLDEAPGLDENLNMKAVGGPCNRSARRPSERPLSGPSRCRGCMAIYPRKPGSVRIGRTLELSPGSGYEEGVL